MAVWPRSSASRWSTWSARSGPSPPSASAPTTTSRIAGRRSATASPPSSRATASSLLTDILGGTPCNLAVSLADKERVDVIAGVNLPLLVKLAKIRGSERLADAVDHAAAAGRKYISAGGLQAGRRDWAPNGAETAPPPPRPRRTAPRPAWPPQQRAAARGNGRP